MIRLAAAPASAIAPPVVEEETAMSDNLRKHTAADAKRINVHEKWEIDYWTKKFGVTEARLKEAAKAAGPMANDIGKYLSRH
jgi:hypothetical protein